ncbi:hypothetical protein EYF80_025668 [Liparis tanakae]|uniref:Uncharacterized protein n=1 Tax=Liparis tanakae TaxID=230148 RepID=A0A4Z2HF41_9TELE|nr:hypothetical protein EYF80_025668 [Liparis tanakae]
MSSSTSCSGVLTGLTKPDEVLAALLEPGGTLAVLAVPASRVALDLLMLEAAAATKPGRRKGRCSLLVKGQGGGSALVHFSQEFFSLPRQKLLIRYKLKPEHPRVTAMPEEDGQRQASSVLRVSHQVVVVTVPEHLVFGGVRVGAGGRAVALGIRHLT